MRGVFFRTQGKSRLEYFDTVKEGGATRRKTKQLRALRGDPSADQRKRNVRK